jgi:hypothetical protein
MSHRFASILLPAWCAMAALAAPAAAAPAEPYRIDVPAGWNLLSDQSQRLGEILTAELASTPPVPGLTFQAQARNWRGPDAGVVVTWLAATAPATDAPAAVRALLDHMRATPTHAALNDGDTRVLSWRDVAAEGTAEGHLAWQHVANGTTTLSRALAYVTATGQPAMVRADCIIPAIDDAALAAPRAACETVLASLALTVHADQRAPLGALPPSAPAAADTATDMATGTATGLAAAGQPSQTPAKRSSDLPPAPSLRAPAPDSQGILVMQPAAPEKRSPNWLYILGAALLVGGAYLVLRGRRTEEEGPDDEDDDGEDAADRRAGRSSEDAEVVDGPGAGTRKDEGNGADRDDEDPERT